MKPNQKKLKHLQYLFCATLITISIVACGSGGTTSTNNSANGVNLVAPDNYPVGVIGATQIPVVVQNTTSNNLTNTDYSLVGAGASIDATSAKNCASIPANSSCIINLKLSKDSTPRSLTLNSNSSLGKNSTQINLINPAGDTYDKGADGLIPYFPHNVQANKNNADTLVPVTILVNSVNSGDFNTIKIVSANGIPLRFDSLSGNTGGGLTNLAKGTVVSLLAHVPNGASIYGFKLQTSYGKDKSVSNIVNGTNMNYVVPAEQLSLTTPKLKKAATANTAESCLKITDVSATGNNSDAEINITTSNTSYSGLFLVQNTTVNPVTIRNIAVSDAPNSFTPSKYLKIQPATESDTAVGTTKPTICAEGLNLQPQQICNVKVVTSSLSSAVNKTGYMVVGFKPTTAPESSPETTQSKPININKVTPANNNNSSQLSITADNSYAGTLTNGVYTMGLIYNSGSDYTTGGITITNNSDIPLTEFIQMSDSPLFTGENDGCPNTLKPFTSCNYTFHFGATTTGEGTYKGNIAITGDASININLQGIVANVNDNTVSYTYSGLNNGDGTTDNPYQVTQNSSASIAYTFINNTGYTISNLWVSQDLQDSNWSITDNTCYGTIGIGASCTYTIALNTSILGSDNVSIATAYFVTGTKIQNTTLATSNISNSIVNVYPSAVINITPFESNILPLYESYTVSASLTGGYSGIVDQVSTTQLSQNSSYTPNVISSSCQLSSESPTCIAYNFYSSNTESASNVVLGFNHSNQYVSLLMNSFSYNSYIPNLISGDGNGNIYYSINDGESWNLWTTSTIGQVNAITFAPNVGGYIAVGNNGAVGLFAGGFKTATNNALNKVVAGANGAVAVGNNGLNVFFPNLSNNPQSPVIHNGGNVPSSNNIQGLAYNPITNTYAAGTANCYLYTSADNGATWTGSQYSFSGQKNCYGFTSIVYVPNSPITFVAGAVGSGYYYNVISFQESSNLWSPWSGNSTLNSDSYGNGVIQANGNFLAGNNGDVIVYLNTLSNWTNTTTGYLNTFNYSNTNSLNNYSSSFDISNKYTSYSIPNPPAAQGNGISIFITSAHNTGAVTMINGNTPSPLVQIMNGEQPNALAFGLNNFAVATSSGNIYLLSGCNTESCNYTNWKNVYSSPNVNFTAMTGVNSN